MHFAQLEFHGILSKFNHISASLWANQTWFILLNFRNHQKPRAIHHTIKQNKVYIPSNYQSININNFLLTSHVVRDDSTQQRSIECW